MIQAKGCMYSFSIKAIHKSTAVAASLCTIIMQSAKYQNQLVSSVLSTPARFDVPQHRIRTLGSPSNVILEKLDLLAQIMPPPGLPRCETSRRLVVASPSIVFSIGMQPLTQ